MQLLLCLLLASGVLANTNIRTPILQPTGAFIHEGDSVPTDVDPMVEMVQSFYAEGEVSYETASAMIPVLLGVQEVVPGSLAATAIAKLTPEQKSTLVKDLKAIEIVEVMESSLNGTEKAMEVAMIMEGEKIKTEDAELIDDVKMVMMGEHMDNQDLTVLMKANEMVETAIEGTESDALMTADQEEDVEEVATGEEDEIPAGEYSVMHLIGLCRSRFLKKENKDKLIKVLEQPKALRFWKSMLDFDNDHKISIQEWRKMYSDKLSPYWAKALKQEMQIPMEEWITVDTNKDGFVDLKKELFPTLMTMSTEPIFRGIVSALYNHYDLNQNGFLDQTPTASPKFPNATSEYAAYANNPVVKEIAALPMASEQELVTELDAIMQEVGEEAVKDVMETLQDEEIIDAETEKEVEKTNNA